MARVWLAALAAFAALAYAGPAGAHAGSETPVVQACDKAGAYLTQGRLATARDAYLKALTKPAAPCVVSGLVAVYAAVRREAAYCAAGDAFAKAGEDDEARRQYAQAVMQNTSSDCGLEGLGASSGSKSFWDRSRDGAHRFVDYLPSFPIQLGSLLLMVVFAIGLALIRSAVLRKASLVVRPFEDRALDQRVGSAFSGLVEEQLVRFWQTRQRARDDGYNLDLVVANVELLAQDESLGDAVGELAQVPQLGLLAAVLSFIDRVFLQRRLSVAGELLPEGANGCGVALSLFKRKHLEARGTVWERLPAAATGDSSAATAAPAATPPADAPPTMSRYYGLAGHAAAWVQYQASRVLDDRVGLITSNAESFSELSAGIDEHRTAAGEEEDADASKHYDEAAQRYDHALKFDRENVAALVNLALVRARHLQSEEPIAEQPDSGKAMVEKPASEDATATKPDSEEAIPNKPAVRGRHRQARAGRHGSRSSVCGDSAETEGDPETPGARRPDVVPHSVRAIASQQLHAGQFKAAADTARQLVNSTCAVLTEIGWRWANHTPTYFTSWYKRFPAWLWRVVRRIGRRARRRSVLGDWELARFLARTVEPAAVVVWASALVEDGKTAMVLQKTDHVPPLDRRKKDFDPSQEDNAWLASYLDELLAVNSNQAEKPEQARECKQAGESTQSKRPLLERLKLLVKDLIGSLGASRWRPPDKLNARVHYNLACFFSRLAKRDDDESKEAHLNLSAMHLTCCLAGEWGPRRGESRHWARRDPGLDALNDTDRFEEIVGRELTSAGVKGDVSSPAHIALRNAAVITGWVLALVGLVAILLAVFPGIPFT